MWSFFQTHHRHTVHVSQVFNTLSAVYILPKGPKPLKITRALGNTEQQKPLPLQSTKCIGCCNAMHVAAAATANILSPTPARQQRATRALAAAVYGLKQPGTT
jgi:hypothetical protein